MVILSQWSPMVREERILFSAKKRMWKNIRVAFDRFCGAYYIVEIKEKQA